MLIRNSILDWKRERNYASRVVLAPSFGHKASFCTRHSLLLGPGSQILK